MLRNRMQTKSEHFKSKQKKDKILLVTFLKVTDFGGDVRVVSLAGICISPILKKMLHDEEIKPD